MCHYLSLLLCWTYLYVFLQGNWLFLRHLALRDSVLIAFQAATDGRLIGGCHAGDYLQLPRFIIGVLITTGFAKISAIFINSETEAILPTDTGYWECDRSRIKSWIGEYCKNSRSSLDVRSDLIDLLRVVLGSVPRGYLQYLPPTFAKFNSPK